MSSKKPDEVSPRRPIIRSPKERGMNWVNTTNVPCQYCGHTWHKHELWCPHYDSNARCRAQHRFFLRSCDKDRPEGRYEYECNYCSVPPVFMAEEMPKQPPHPFCAEGFHYWVTCGDSCASCGVWCSGCGKKGTWLDLKQMMLLDYGAHEAWVTPAVFNERKRLLSASLAMEQTPVSPSEKKSTEAPRSGCI